LNSKPSGVIFAVVAVVIIVAALASTLAGSPAGPSSTAAGQTSAYATSPDGLRLTLQISSSQIAPGDPLVINITETNTNAEPLNESARSSWMVDGLRMSACYDSVYPFGVAVFQGHLTRDSLPPSARLNLYPVVPCPLLVRYITGYYFQAASDVALVLPGSGSGVPMASGLASSGNYTTGTNRVDFAPGEYTVVAGDEWGSLVLLHFSVD